MTTKTSTRQTHFVHLVSSDAIFFYNDIVPHVPYFLPVKFSSEYYFDKVYFQLPENVTWSNE